MIHEIGRLFSTLPGGDPDAWIKPDLIFPIQKDWFVEDFLAWVRRSPYAFLYLFGFEIAKVTEDGKPPVVELSPVTLLQQMIVEGQEEGEIRSEEPETLVWSFTLLVELARHYAAGWRGEEDLNRFAGAFAEMIWRALRADGRGDAFGAAISRSEQRKG